MKKETKKTEKEIKNRRKKNPAKTEKRNKGIEGNHKKGKSENREKKRRKPMKKANKKRKTINIRPKKTKKREPNEVTATNEHDRTSMLYAIGKRTGQVTSVNRKPLTRVKLSSRYKWDIALVVTDVNPSSLVKAWVEVIKAQDDIELSCSAKGGSDFLSGERETVGTVAPGI